MHEIVDLGNWSIAAGRHLNQWQVRDLEVRVGTHRDDAIKELCFVESESQRTKTTAGMTGNDSADAAFRNRVARFDSWDEFIANVVGIVALRAGVDVLAAAPMALKMLGSSL